MMSICRLWDDSEMECLQLSGIGDVIAQRLADRQLARLDAIAKVGMRVTSDDFLIVRRIQKC